MIKIGVVGYGYWGPNIVRNFNSQENVVVSSLSDLDPVSLERAKKIYPNINTTTHFTDITTSAEVDAVAIVTPVSSHFELAKSALENGKHIFVEKPFTASVREAEQLLEIAERKNLKIMVDHTFLFTGAVKKIKELVDNDTLGELYYYDSTRVNLGLFQHDVNVVWDLAPHDFSIMDYVISEKPVEIRASGVDHFGRSLENVAYLTVFFQSNMIAHFNVNWLSPVKIRQTLIGGEKKMLVWNDVEADEKIKIYDRGVDISTKESVYNLLVNYRSADMCAPRIEQIEALKLETEYFIDCIKSDKTPFNDGHSGLRVVRILEACDKSLKGKGVSTKL